MNVKKRFYFALALFQVFLIFAAILSYNGLVRIVEAQEEIHSFDYYNSFTALSLAISAALSVGLTVLGSAWAMKTVGTAAISSLLEGEKSFFKAFLIVALCEALAVYGLIVAILLWTKIPTPI
ncbi:MAG: hypothetical protein GF329_12925 [Candidatus Lokiarchaeota archaeon]|nr:hypothetical protein [Candidatus Lokiarchaeota archaeon]